MLAIIFAILTFIGWGFGDAIGGFVARKINAFSSSLWMYVFNLLISSLFLPFFWNQFSGISLHAWIFIIALGIFGPIPVLFFYEGVIVGNASLVGTIVSSFAALTVILSVIFLGDKLLPTQIVPIIIIFVGLILSSLDLKSFSFKKLLKDKGVLYGLTAMIMWGVYYTFIRVPVREVGWFWPSYLNTVIGVPVVLICMKFMKVKVEKLPNLKIFAISFFGSLIMTVAIFSYNFAAIVGQTSIIAPIAGSYPVLYVIVSRFLFNDRLTKQQIIGILVTLSGIVALSLLSA